MIKAEDPDLKKGYEHYRSFHRYMERAHPDLSEQYKEKYGGMNMGDRHMGMHVAATAGSSRSWNTITGGPDNSSKRSTWTVVVA